MLRHHLKHLTSNHPFPSRTPDDEGFPNRPLTPASPCLPLPQEGRGGARQAWGRGRQALRAFWEHLRRLALLRSRHPHHADCHFPLHLVSQLRHACFALSHNRAHSAATRRAPTT